MIKVKLLLADYLANSGDTIDQGRQSAIKTIKGLLTQIDFKAEKIPDNNKEMFIRLLTSLKGEELDKNEKSLVEEIVEYS